MSGFTLRIDGELFNGFRAGDERALEAIFRSAYPDLVQATADQLHGDRSAASRVVEHLFTHVWSHRDSIATSGDLERILTEGVHEGAVREESRRAVASRFARGGDGAHRHAPRAGGGATVDEAWEHVVRTLHASHADAERAMAEHGRHSTAQHVAELGREKSWAVPAALAAGVIMLLAGGMWWLDAATEDATISNALGAAEVQAINAGPGRVGQLTLDDSTQVRLAPVSVLRLPKQYLEYRAARLDGAATFAARPGERPIHVRVGRNVITAPSGSFEVSGDTVSPVIVRVREGPVTVRRMDGDGERILASGQAMYIGADGAMRDATVAEIDNALGWTEGMIVLTNVPLRDALSQLRRWYSAEVFVADESLKERPVTMRASLDSLTVALNAIAASAGLEFGWEARNMVFREMPSAVQAGRRR